MKTFTTIVQSLTALALIVIASNLTIMTRNFAPKPASVREEILQVVGRAEINMPGRGHGFLARTGAGDLRVIPYDDGSMWGRGLQPQYIVAEIDADGTNYKSVELIPPLVKQ